MGSSKGSKRDVWIEAGLAEMARHGVDGVRVEVLAVRLGVTKGGFYRQFKDRRALLDGILEKWSAGRIAAIAQQASLHGDTPRNRLRALISALLRTHEHGRHGHRNGHPAMGSNR